MEQEEDHVKGPKTRRRSEAVNTPDRVLRPRTEKTEVVTQSMKRDNTPQKEATPRKSLKKTVDVSTPSRRSIRGTSVQPESSPSVKKIGRGRRSSSVQPESPNKEVTPPSKGKRASLLPIAESISTPKSRKSINSTLKPETIKAQVPDLVNEVKRVTRRSISSPAKDLQSPARSTKRTSLLKEVKSSPTSSSPESEGKRTPPNTRRQVKNLNLSPVEEANDEKLSPKNAKESSKISPKDTKKTSPRKTLNSEKKSLHNAKMITKDVEESVIKTTDLKSNSVDDELNNVIVASAQHSHELTNASPTRSNSALGDKDKQDSFTGSEDSGIKEMEEFHGLEAKVPDSAQELAGELYEDQNNDPNGKHADIVTSKLDLKKDAFPLELSSIIDIDSPRKVMALVKKKSPVVILEQCRSSCVNVTNTEESKIKLASPSETEIHSKKIEEDEVQKEAGLNDLVKQSQINNAVNSVNTLTEPVITFTSATPISKTELSPNSSMSSCVTKDGVSVKKALLIRFSQSPEKNNVNSSDQASKLSDSSKISEINALSLEHNYDEADKSNQVSLSKFEESDNELTLQLPDSDDDITLKNSSQSQPSDIGGLSTLKSCERTSPKIASLKAIFEKPNVVPIINKMDSLNKSACDSEKSLDTDEIDLSVVSERNYDNTLKSIDSILQDSDEDSPLKKYVPSLPEKTNHLETSLVTKKDDEVSELKDSSFSKKDIEFMDVSSIHEDPHLSTVNEEDEDAINETNTSGLLNEQHLSLPVKDTNELMVITGELSNNTDINRVEATTLLVNDSRHVEMHVMSECKSEFTDSNNTCDEFFSKDMEKSFDGSLANESSNVRDMCTKSDNHLPANELNKSPLLEMNMPENKDSYDATKNELADLELEKSSFLDTSMPSCNSTVIIKRSLNKSTMSAIDNFDEIVSSDDSVKTEEAPSDITYRESQEGINLVYDVESSDSDRIPGKLKSAVRVVTPLNKIHVKASKFKEDLEKSIVSLSELIQDSDSQQEIDEEVQTISSEESSSDESAEILENILVKQVDDDSENDSDYFPKEENYESSEEDSLDESLQIKSISGKDFIDDEAEEGNESSSSGETSVEDIPVMHIQQQTNKDSCSNSIQIKDCGSKNLPQWKVEDNSAPRKNTKLKLNKKPSAFKKKVSKFNVAAHQTKVEYRKVGCGVKFSEINVLNDNQVLRSFTGCGVKFKISKMSEPHLEYLLKRPANVLSCGSSFSVEDLKHTNHLNKDNKCCNNGTWKVYNVDADKIIHKSRHVFQCNSNFKVEDAIPPITMMSMLKDYFKSELITKKSTFSSVVKEKLNNKALQSNKPSDINSADSSQSVSGSSCPPANLKRPLDSKSNIASEAKKTKKDVENRTDKKSSEGINNKIVFIHNLWIGVNALDIKELLKKNHINGFIKINLSLCSAFKFLEEQGYARIDFETTTDAQKCLVQCSKGLYFKGNKLKVSTSKNT